MIHISVYVPLKDADRVKQAMFDAGAGRIGNYDCCSFDIKGVGQFRPLAGSSPHIGEVGAIEKVEELKIEMVMEESVVQDVVRALKAAHPYETPAFYMIKTLDYTSLV